MVMVVDLLKLNLIVIFFQVRHLRAWRRLFFGGGSFFGGLRAKAASSCRYLKMVDVEYLNLTVSWPVCYKSQCNVSKEINLLNIIA